MVICCICFMECTQYSECSHWECEEKMCSDCLTRFLDICWKEHTVPRCIYPQCQSLYLEQTIPKHPKDRSLLKKYQVALFRGLLKDNETSTREDEKTIREHMFQQIRNERLAFLHDQFPWAIQKGVEIMYASELKRIHRDNKLMLEKTTTLPTKRCFRLFCQGTMISQKGIWECRTCKSQYCKECEGEYKKDDHVCRQENVASVEWKKALPHCPHCFLPIEKAEGCDAVTCARCMKNFNYSTGLPCQSGNHGKSIPITIANESIERMKKALQEMETKTKTNTEQRNELGRMLTEISDALSEYNITSFSTPTWEWKPMEIRVFQQYLQNHHYENHSENHSPNNEEEDEERIAKLVSNRVNKLESKRQHIEWILRRLGHMESELRHL